MIQPLVELYGGGTVALKVAWCGMETAARARAGPPPGKAGPVLLATAMMCCIPLTGVLAISTFAGDVLQAGMIARC
jgi:hypothetical protein